LRPEARKENVDESNRLVPIETVGPLNLSASDVTVIVDISAKAKSTALGAKMDS
jgi:hypothetical protein